MKLLNNELDMNDCACTLEEAIILRNILKQRVDDLPQQLYDKYEVGGRGTNTELITAGLATVGVVLRLFTPERFPKIQREYMGYLTPEYNKCIEVGITLGYFSSDDEFNAALATDFILFATKFFKFRHGVKYSPPSMFTYFKDRIDDVNLDETIYYYLITTFLSGMYDEDRLDDLFILIYNYKSHMDMLVNKEDLWNLPTVLFNCLGINERVYDDRFYIGEDVTTKQAVSMLKDVQKDLMAKVNMINGAINILEGVQ